MNTFSITIAGLRRELPIVEIRPGTKIAFFQLLGDVELCEAVAREFLRQTQATADVILTPELKAIPLAHELARLAAIPYMVARKEAKSYMASAISEPVLSFTAARAERLWLDMLDVAKLYGKRVWLVDDVVTTGETLAALERLVRSSGGMVEGRFVVLKEGLSQIRSGEAIVTLGELPIMGAEQEAQPTLFTETQDFHHRALELRSLWPIVYTAISKEYFCYRVLISKFVLEQERVPFNPFMSFDFGFFGLLPKDSILTANNNGVRVADELWMFGPISDGAYAEILIAREASKRIRYFSIDKAWRVSEIQESEAQYECGIHGAKTPDAYAGPSEFPAPTKS